MRYGHGLRYRRGMGYGARARAGAQGGARPQLLTPNARDSVDHDDLVGVPLLVHLYDERGVVEGRSWSDGVERRHPLIAQAGRSSTRLEAPVQVVDVESASLQPLVRERGTNETDWDAPLTPEPAAAAASLEACARLACCLEVFQRQFPRRCHRGRRRRWLLGRRWVINAEHLWNQRAF